MAEKFDEYVILNLFGHVRRAGRLTEQQIAGHGFLRLDIPVEDGWVTQIVNPTAVYDITPTTEELARAAAATRRHEPVRRYELPAAKPPARNDCDEYDDEVPF